MDQVTIGQFVPLFQTFVWALLIFLSIFNVHINRSPCNAKVAKITYKEGRYRNAMNPESGQVNESNDLALVRIGEPEDRLIIRQISGAIARRIVCSAHEGQELTGGEKIGMIKFGSRTELYLPVRDKNADSKSILMLRDDTWDRSCPA